MSSNKTFPTIEIVATERAKKSAAEKFDIPFTYGEEIETYGLFQNKEMHITVDTSNIHGFKKREYYKYMKKQYNKEIQKILCPNKALINVLTIAGLSLSALTGLYCCTPNDIKEPENNTPKTIQKSPVLKQNSNMEKTRE